MASLHWIHAPMNASKSAQLLMVAHNYEEGRRKVMVIKPMLDTRDGDMVKSRALGVSRKADLLVARDAHNFMFDYARRNKPDVVLVDEAQFLQPHHIDELGEIVDRLEIPVMAYGLRTDSFGNMFEGSKRLFEIADKFQEFITICPCCGGKAIFNMRIDDKTGKPVFEGDQVSPGNNYLPVCRKYYKELKEQSTMTMQPRRRRQ